MSEDVNQHRQGKSVDSKNHQIIPQENKFVLCEFGEKVLALHNEYPDDADFGEQASQLILLWKDG